MQSSYRTILQKAYDFITASQNADGGWGYKRGGMSYVEPTAFALMALFSPYGAGGQNVADIRYQAVLKGMAWLRSQQHADGGWGVMRDDQVSGWMTYPAFWLMNVLQRVPELVSYYGKPEDTEIREKARTWILNRGREDAVDNTTYNQVKKLFQIDSNLRGWGWGAGESGWVIPTSLAMISLIVEDPPIMRDEKEIINAKDYLRDRACPEGGWNVGNPWMLGKKLPPTADATSFALVAWRIALTASDFGANGKVVNAGLGYLEEIVKTTNSDHTLVLSTWALTLFREPAEVEKIRARLFIEQERTFDYKSQQLKIKTISGQDKESGGWANSGYTTAFATFALLDERYYFEGN